MDFEPGAVVGLSGMDGHLTVQPCADPSRESFIVLGFRDGQVSAGEVRLGKPEAATAVEFALHKVLEARLSLAALGVGSG